MPKNMKNNTLKEILDIILYESPSTQDEIADKLNISRRYVTKLLKPLIDENVIKKAYVVDLKKFNEISENFETEHSVPEYSGEYFIKEMMKEMGEQILKQFKWSFEAMKNNDLELAQKALDEDQNTNHMYSKIKSSTDTVLSLDPFFEFNNTIMFNEIAYDMERIGDHICHIPKFVLEEHTEVKKPVFDVLEEMYDMASTMFKKAVKSFLKRDLNIKDKMDRYEHELTNLQKLATKKISSQMAKADINKNNSPYYLKLFRVVKSFERIGDISIEITEATTQFYIENQSTLRKQHFKYFDQNK
ncbi:PhoU domain-containing protein [Candidatus Methanosphaera massiliense]|jgi:phosphate transport system protein|uniref:PhoU domain-containing protein n=1 Tax=Methanosphaera TaxID=2316 RepID=UPI00237FE843|nr:PhoU domain-containing protein [Candidatus Methanosphaera massiliense]MDD6285840.1 PhoU domain-containing protein [Methanobacteriaceae archaeon]MDE4078304.1 PhoU domain-containing protein [Candidatus Methanosphaera massiliense]MDY2744870.1 PhoU domain-containing protein [Methanosphaera sp.]